MSQPFDVRQQASQRAEEAVLGAILKEPSAANLIVGKILEPDHFFFRPYRIIFEELIERLYADDDIDALVVGEAVGRKVAEAWDIPEREAVDRILALRGSGDPDHAIEHAEVIKRHADYRRLVELGFRLVTAAGEETDDPEALAAAVSADAMKIATDTVVRSETFTFAELGKRWTTHTKETIAARQAGVELGAYYGIHAIDAYTKGHRPGELLMCGGAPGSGKSALWWVAAINFARRQMQRPVDQRVGTLILSMEMDEDPSSDRFAQAVSRVSGEKLRSGSLTREELTSAAERWARQKNLPLYVNHASHLRTAQLRAIVVEAIRKWNVGVVVIDHFKMIQPDRRYDRPEQADDEIVIFLKTQLARDLNTAVVCLAHTVKSVNTVDKRPRMEDLRGSGMISAFADFVGLLYRPFEHAPKRERERGLIGEDEAELIWDKSRHSGKGTGEFHMDLASMTITS